MIRLLAIMILLTSCTSHLSGEWQGKTGPFNTAFKFNDNGKGLLCYSGRNVNKIEWARYSGGIISTETGQDVIIKSVNNNKMIVEADSYGAIEYIFTRGIKKASWFCRKKLNE